MSFDLNRNKNSKLSNFGHGKDSLSQISKATWKDMLPIIEQLIKLQSEALYLGVLPLSRFFFLWNSTVLEFKVKSLG